MVCRQARFLLGLVFGAAFSIAPASADYAVGQRMEFRDDYLGYGGGWVPCVITCDYGPAAVERYLVKIDGYGEINARVGLLRPTDGSPRMVPKTPAENNYKGPEADAAADAIMAQRHGQQAPVAQTPAAAPQAVPQAAPVQHAAPRAMAQAAAPTTGAAVPRFGAAGRMPANAVAAALGKGLFPNGKPLGVPGQTNYLLNRSGQKSVVCVAPPGDETFIGRWNLKAGGSWSKVLGSERNLGDGRTEYSLEYNFPVDADVLVINPGGTWFKQFAGKRTSGSWIDLGQNVVQVIGFEEDDWTGSVKKGQMEMRSPVGEWEYGRRF